MKKTFIKDIILGAFITGVILSGCGAYNSLVGHPIHVLFQQHKNQEAVEQYDRQQTTNTESK